jgi:hypothetical protein
LSKLSVRRRNDVMRLLAQHPDAETLLPNILVHDRANDEVRVFPADKSK